MDWMQYKKSARPSELMLYSFVFSYYTISGYYPNRIYYCEVKKIAAIASGYLSSLITGSFSTSIAVVFISNQIDS